MQTGEQEQPLSQLRFLIAGGGTGGHLFPALAVAEELRRLEPNCQILFLGSERGIEVEHVPRRGFRLIALPVRGLRRGKLLGNLGALSDFVRSVSVALEWVHRFRPSVVLGTGGYSSAPAGVAALVLGVPMVLHEQNSYPGLVTRWLSRWAREVYLSFERARAYLAKPERARVTGNPVRADLSRKDKRRARLGFGLDPERAVVLVFGGSQGAEAINTAVLEALPELLGRSDAQILWATGPAHAEKVRSQVSTISEAARRVKILPFIEDMAAAYSACDLAICRSGATTLAELAALGVPAVLIPYPYAAEDHQTHNALTFVQAGAAVMMSQSDLTPERLAESVLSLLSRSEELGRMAGAALKLARTRAAEEIATRMIELARGNVR